MATKIRLYINDCHRSDTGKEVSCAATNTEGSDEASAVINVACRIIIFIVIIIIFIVVIIFVIIAFIKQMHQRLKKNQRQFEQELERRSPSDVR